VRIWHVPFGELDGQRVLGQHNEIHALWSLIVVKGMKWDERWSNPYYRWLLWDVHARSVAEMLLHGWTGHKTPIEEPTEISYEASRTEYGTPDEVAELQAADRWDLVRRWDGKYKGRVPMPDAYIPVLERFHAEGGCNHLPYRVEEMEAKVFKGWMLCLGCKRWMTNDKGQTWRKRYDAA
jgi:pyrimidine dimer DNA glycosylase